MIFHPEKNLIQKFALGEITSPMAAMISAHFDHCPSCRNEYLQIFNKQTIAIKEESLKLTEAELEDAFLNIIDNLSEKPNPVEQLTPVEINISGEKIQLPLSMKFLKEKEINWKEFGKKNAIAPVLTTEQGNLYLIYIGQGEEVPEHGHTNKEYSYVVAGSYHDGINSFNTGDFSVSNERVNHIPKATSEDGCLVISWVEGRLNFFKGIFSPLNKLLWWYLHRA